MKIYLLPVPISDNSQRVLSGRVMGIFKRIKNVVVENEKSFRSFIKNFLTDIPQSELNILSLPREDEHQAWDDLLGELKTQKEWILVSDAGNPCIADPGYRLVDMARQARAQILPFEGPSSIMMALMASGFSGQSFSFHGYLPRDRNALRGALRKIEQDCQKTGATQIFMETPYRNHKLLETLYQALSSNTRLCIAAGLSSEDEYIDTLKVSTWKKKEELNIDKIPTVFLIGE